MHIYGVVFIYCQLFYWMTADSSLLQALHFSQRSRAQGLPYLKKWLGLRIWLVCESHVFIYLV